MPFKSSGYAPLETDADGDEGSNPMLPGGEKTATTWFSKCFFLWASPAIDWGYKERLEEEQLWDLAGCDTVETCTNELLSAWKTQTQGMGVEDMASDEVARGEGPSLLNMPLTRALWKVHKGKYFKWLVIKILNDFNQTIPAILLNKILFFLQDEEASLDEGIVLVITAFVMMSIKTVAENMFFFELIRMSIQIKVAIIGIVFRKSLRLTPGARAYHSEGQIMNLMQQDSERLMWFIPLSPMLLSGTLQIFLNSMLLFYYIGVTSVVGIIMLTCLIPINRVLVGMQMKLRFATQKHTDERVKLINEVLKGIRVVKTYAWEEFMEARISAIRSKEIKMIRTRSILGAFSSLFMWAAPPFATVAVFVLYNGVGHPMNETSLPVLFTSLMLFNNLRFPLMMFPWILTMFADAKVSMGRLQEFLMRDEVPDEVRKYTSDPGVALRVKNGQFHWQTAPKKQDNMGWSGGGKGGGSGDNEPPNLCNICKSDGVGKLFLFWTEPWKAFKKQVVCCFFILMACIMMVYRALKDVSIPTTTEAGDPISESAGLQLQVAAENEKLLALFIAAFFLFMAIFLCVVKQKRPEEPGSKTEEQKDSTTAFKLSMDLTIEKGSVTMIIGSVGCGKSSVIQACLGEMDKIDGEVLFAQDARVSYCSQQAWLMNATLKQNITFVNELDEDRYQHVLDLVSLRQDLNELPLGDRTEIGERGINLSGGQKARISIARAMYNDADIYIFDDVLSALDAHVGKHVFECCVGELRAAGKTVVMATNQLHVLPRSDQVVFVKHDEETKEGRLGNVGTFTELMQEEDFALLMREVGISEADFDDSPMASPTATLSSKDNVKEKQENSIGKGEAKDGELVEEEEREEGEVAWSVYWGYLKAAKAQYLFTFTIGFTIVGNLTQVLNDMWLTWWTQDSFNLAQWQYELLYILTSMLYALCVFASSLIFAYVGIYGSRNLHISLLHDLLGRKQAFYDVTPVGRIISRFAKDISAVDERLGMMFNSVLGMFIMMGQTLAVIAGITGWAFMLGITPIMYLYYTIQRTYKIAALQYKRMESVTRSPIYNHTAETLSGISTIRAYYTADKAERKNADVTNINTKAMFIMRTAERWLDLRLQSIGNSVVLVAGLMGVASKGSGVYSGLIGIALVYGMRITQMLSWAVRSSTELAINMNSVERILHYTDNPDPEEPLVKKLIEPPTSWPSAGKVTFSKLCMRYRPGLELVLHDLDFTVEGGEKVGIVGRTGAGKSSLMLALFRMIEPASGAIIIDGVDISTISLNNLRSRMSIIPQDPVLFSGDIRFNLDPQEQKSDHDVWSVLERVHLDGKVRGLDGGLAGAVSEGGESFSVGQRQLICMARAMLRGSQILLMDEATSSVDIDTDRRIQELVREEFESRTILTIAHRLNTIIDYDKICVINAGHVAEMDTPRALLQNPDSKFTALVKETGEDSDAKLRAIVGL